MHVFRKKFATFKLDLELQLRSIFNFSFSHKLQVFAPALIGISRNRIDQFILVNCFLFCVSFLNLFGKFSVIFVLDVIERFL